MREISFLLLAAATATASPGAQEIPQTRVELEKQQAIPEELSLQKALEIFRERSPLLFAERLRIDAARGDLEQAGKLPNPAFALETEDFATRSGASENRNIFLSAEQEIETAGKRKKRSLVAESLLSAARNDYGAFERFMTYRLKVAHAALVLAQSSLALANENLAEYDRIVRLSRLRYERGETSGGELRRVEAERLGFLEDQVAAEIEVENARAELLGLLGLPEYSKPFQAVPPLRLATEPAEVEALLREALAARPELRAQEERKAAALRDVALEEALAVPNLVPFVGYQQASTSGDSRQNFLNFGVSVGVPVFNRNQGGVARAQAESRREEELVRATRYRVAVEVRQARQAFISELKRIGFFEDTYLRTSREARDIAEAAYRMGAENLINFLDASRVYRKTLQAYNRALFDLRAAGYGLELALGKDLS